MGCKQSKKEKVPPISYDQLMVNFGNDKIFVDMIVGEGVKELEGNIANMKNDLKDKNLKNLGNLKLTSHSIKGSAANITCTPMSEMASEIEVIVDGAGSGDFHKIRSDIGNIINRMNVELNRIKSSTIKN